MQFLLQSKGRHSHEPHSTVTCSERSELHTVSHPSLHEPTPPPPARDSYETVRSLQCGLLRVGAPNFRTWKEAHEKAMLSLVRFQVLARTGQRACVFCVDFGM